MDITALFLTGVGTGFLAGGTTCAAVQLGLLTGAVTGGRPGGRSDLRPVATFLGAKLISHAALGAVLGLAGGAVQPGPQVRGALLAVASLTLALFALDLLNFRPAKRLLRRGREEGPAACHAPPALAGEPAAGPSGQGPADLTGTADRDGRDASKSRRRAVVLGAATVLVPCGLTLSAELLAVTSRSAAGGAVVMGAFVLGTAPLFGVVGVTVGRTLAALRGRVTVLLAAGLLVASGWTLLSGLRLGGWLPAGGGGTAAAAESARFVHTDASGTQVVTIWALDQGYRPALVTARAGVPTVLVLKTRGTRGHTRAFTLPARGKDVILPVDGDTRIDLGVPHAGRMRFVCASGHYPGAITFR
ncbi:sulfite exporter TauE/SafE family protein [Actinomadura graeca]|uniref:Sulfite exporter TauE/SafE family protein n=1 Tax=Actinomadura graeca TaxID=2750812 RepID=A0ABX8R6K8_9ACTN|nr:sulfite exporter TauE/SafE family protein [Actinomadura graeca]QXJ26059.1 sulfite exporter TauE/SafE family protein [Actinomadura graeca]